MKDPKDITALVYDHGLFLPLAAELAKTYKRVIYATPSERSATTLNDCIVGDGFANIEKLPESDDLWDIKSEVDLWIFPDIQHAGLQLELERQGFAVWGSRRGDSLEMQRQKFHRVLGSLGLEVAPYEPIEGLTRLREYLKDKENKFIKISRFRGSMETTKFRSMDADEALLDHWAVKFGPAKEKMIFLVFDELPTDLEIGGDTYGVVGKWPKRMLQGYEWKDKGYLASVTDVTAMPQPIQEVMEAFADILATNNYRNFWSMEIRLVGEKAYFIDPCCRGPMPGTGSQLRLIKNLPEIMLAGAHGELVEPDYRKPFCAEAIMSLKVPEKGAWGKTHIPGALVEFMRCSNACEINGAICFPPVEGHGDEIGWLQGEGDSVKEAVQNLLEHAKELPDGVSAATESMVDLLREIHKAEAEGMEFTPGRVPEPAMVVEAED